MKRDTDAEHAEKFARIVKSGGTFVFVGRAKGSMVLEVFGSATRDEMQDWFSQLLEDLNVNPSIAQQ